MIIKFKTTSVIIIFIVRSEIQTKHYQHSNIKQTTLQYSYSCKIYYINTLIHKNKNYNTNVKNLQNVYFCLVYCFPKINALIHPS